MDLQRSAFLSTYQLNGNYGRPAPAREETGTDAGVFGRILEEKSSREGVRFSKHASFRMNDRGMEMTGDQLDRLSDGTSKAAEKGIKESLVLIDNMAFIVNVPSRTVVTAMDSADARENVFTNINGAVIN
ncbi:MAG: flagellar protein [Lachnospiraceae bacterium]|nr:flagellar protein [Lachnospiraceae bacterium]